MKLKILSYEFKNHLTRHFMRWYLLKPEALKNMFFHGNYQKLEQKASLVNKTNL